MNETHFDAYVFFGATGNLAFKKIFPSLQAMGRRGHLNVPVIGIGRSGASGPDRRAGPDRQSARSGRRDGIPAATSAGEVPSLAAQVSRGRRP